MSDRLTKSHLPLGGKEPQRTEPSADAGAVPDLSEVEVPGYEILSELGRGGMGVVYQARHLQLNRIVALKMILAGMYASSEAQVRFFAEAEAIARLQHPNIVQIFEVHQTTKLPCMALELVEGGSLATRLKDGPLDPGEAAILVKQMAEGICSAHRIGIIHRDLKPENVLLTEEGIPKIGDFGLARSTEGGPELTQTGAIVGTPSYMSPEQALGKKEIGPATDIYALGVNLYECLTGRPPFKTATPYDTILQVVRQEPVPPRRLNAGIPVDLETICLKCLEKDVARRYRTAEKLAEDLDCYLKGEPIAARPIGSIERLLKWVKRSPGMAGMAGVSVLALLILMIGGLIFTIRLGKEQAETQVALHRESQARRAASQAAEQARLHLYNARMQLVQNAWGTPGAERGIPRLLDTCCPIEGEKDLRGFEWYFWWRRLHSQKRMQYCPGAPLQVVISKDGAHFAFSCSNGKIYIQEVATGKQAGVLSLIGAAGIAFDPQKQWLIGCGADSTTIWSFPSRKLLAELPPSHRVAIAPNGKQVAIARKGQIQIWDMSTPEHPSPLHTISAHREDINSLAISPNGSLLASASTDQRIHLWDMATATKRKTLDRHTARIHVIDFSPSGKWLASASNDQRALVWDQSGKVVAILPHPKQDVTALAFLPDDSTLASASLDGVILLRDARTGKLKRRLIGHQSQVYALAVSPDGRHLVSTSLDRTVRLWDLQQQNEPWVLDSHEKSVRSVDCSPNGKLFASGGGDHRIVVHDAASFSPKAILTGHKNVVRSVAFFPDNRRIASASSDQTVRIWDAIEGKQLHCLQGHGEIVRRVAVSANGQWLASASQDQTVRLWNAGNGSLTRALQHPIRVYSVLFLPGDNRLATGDSRGHLRIWDLETGKMIVEQKQLRSGPIHAMALSNDHRLLACACGDHAVRLLDPGNGKRIATLGGHTSSVEHVAFAPDNRAMATASEDGMIKIWDLHAPGERATLKGHTNGARGVAFAPNGQALISCGMDGTIRVWRAASHAEVEQVLEEEARTLLEMLMRESDSTEEAIRQLHELDMISARARNKALSIAQKQAQKGQP